ncbi:Hsp20/alpha crystallin family protein [Prolixibacteraceae bacterium Z1-6]|uniref:Hsp20/alpha crystallin family protein n=1 Tax=Draconibacterium aestuarii TaxID=2998507 RepID=A0A9X3J7A1_9BACT|nr:Hsp20/alpha crystallin family protein [Prolixibacteraceae bacterium Z1-6]
MSLVKFHNPAYNANNVLVNELFNNFFRNDYSEQYVKNCAKPATNVFETEKDFKIEVLLPGFVKEDVNLNVHNNILTIKVDKEKEEKEVEYKYTHREFGAYNFEKQYKLPKSVDTEKIEAKFDSGILVLHLPKKEEALPKVPVDIKIA